MWLTLAAFWVYQIVVHITFAFLYDKGLKDVSLGVGPRNSRAIDAPRELLLPDTRAAGAFPSRVDKIALSVVLARLKPGLPRERPSGARLGFGEYRPGDNDAFHPPESR